MTLARIGRLLCLTGVSLGLGAAYACSLNPQPLPPGETADGSTQAVPGDASMTDFGGDSGGGLLGDGPSGVSSPEGSADGGVPNPPEGGDAADGGDGASDASPDSPDAADGAPADAPSDGEEGGG
jgi:hypothetical protein